MPELNSVNISSTAAHKNTLGVQKCITVKKADIQTSPTVQAKW